MAWQPPRQTDRSTGDGQVQSLLSKFEPQRLDVNQQPQDALPNRPNSPNFHLSLHKPSSNTFNTQPRNIPSPQAASTPHPATQSYLLNSGRPISPSTKATTFSQPATPGQSGARNIHSASISDSKSKNHTPTQSPIQSSTQFSSPASSHNHISPSSYDPKVINGSSYDSATVHTTPFPSSYQSNAPHTTALTNQPTTQPGLNSSLSNHTPGALPSTTTNSSDNRLRTPSNSTSSIGASAVRYCEATGEWIEYDEFKMNSTTTATDDDFFNQPILDSRERRNAQFNTSGNIQIIKQVQAGNNIKNNNPVANSPPTHPSSLVTSRSFCPPGSQPTQSAGSPNSPTNQANPKSYQSPNFFLVSSPHCSYINNPSSSLLDNLSSTGSSNSTNTTITQRTGGTYDDQSLSGPPPTPPNASNNLLISPDGRSGPPPCPFQSPTTTSFPGAISTQPTQKYNTQLKLVTRALEFDDDDDDNDFHFQSRPIAYSIAVNDRSSFYTSFKSMGKASDQPMIPEGYDDEDDDGDNDFSPIHSAKESSKSPTLSSMATLLSPKSAHYRPPTETSISEEESAEIFDGDNGFELDPDEYHERLIPTLQPVPPLLFDHLPFTRHPSTGSRGSQPHTPMGNLYTESPLDALTAFDKSRNVWDYDHPAVRQRFDKFRASAFLNQPEHVLHLLDPNRSQTGRNTNKQQREEQEEQEQPSHPQLYDAWNFPQYFARQPLLSTAVKKHVSVQLPPAIQDSLPPHLPRRKVMEVRIDDTVSGHIATACQTLYGAHKPEGFDPRNFVLKVQGQNSYIDHDSHWWSYSYIRQSIRDGTDVNLYLMERPTPVPLSPEQTDQQGKILNTYYSKLDQNSINHLYTLHRDLDQFPDDLNMKTYHELETEIDYIPITQLNLPISLQLGAIEGLNPAALPRYTSDITSVYLRVVIFHGVDLLPFDVHTKILPASFPSSNPSSPEELVSISPDPFVINTTIAANDSVCVLSRSYGSYESFEEEVNFQDSRCLLPSSQRLLYSKLPREARIGFMLYGRKRRISTNDPSNEGSYTNSTNAQRFDQSNSNADYSNDSSAADTSSPRPMGGPRTLQRMGTMRGVGMQVDSAPVKSPHSNNNPMSPQTLTRQQSEKIPSQQGLQSQTPQATPLSSTKDIQLGFVSSQLFNECGELLQGKRVHRVWAFPAGDAKKKVGGKRDKDPFFIFRAVNHDNHQITNANLHTCLLHVKYQSFTRTVYAPIVSPWTRPTAVELRKSSFHHTVRALCSQSATSLTVSPTLASRSLAATALIESTTPLTLSIHPFTAQQKELIFESRHQLVSNPKALFVFLACIDWTCEAQRNESYFLLQKWAKPTSPTDIMSLLDVRYPDYRVRSYAVEQLELLSDDDVRIYLIQLVQCLKYESYHYSPLAKFLLHRSICSPSVIGVSFFWELKSQVHDPHNVERMTILLEYFLTHVGIQLVHSLTNQLNSVNGLQEVANYVQHIKRSLGYSDEETTQLYHQKLQNLNETLLRPQGRFQLPYKSSFEVTELIVEKCRYMSSKMVPLFLVFKNADPSGAPIYIIFKSGDDLKQDALTLQILRIMDRLWVDMGLDLCLKPYDVIATGVNEIGEGVGMIEVVLNSTTTADVQDEFGGGTFGALKLKTIDSFLRTHNSVESGLYQQAIHNFMYSSAGYCVATFVLGIGDRHNGNIMITKAGHLFHIDFGHFLGNFKKKFGVSRERAAFVFTPEMAYVVGQYGANHNDKPREDYKNTPGFQQFQQLCTTAFQALRTHLHFLETLFLLLIPAGMPELNLANDVEYLEKKFGPHVDVYTASQDLIKELNKSVDSTSRRIDNFMHIWKHK